MLSVAPKTLRIALLLTVTAPLLVHFAWILHVRLMRSELENYRDVPITNIPRLGVKDPRVAPIQVLASFGDVFEPSLGGTDRSFGLIVISATLDPLYTADDMLVWKSNLLVRTSLAYAYSIDPASVETMVHGLILRMVRTNRTYLELIEKTPINEVSYRREYIAERCEPWLERTGENSLLRARGVRWIAVLPLFNSERITDIHERRERLALNVRTAVGRLLTDLDSLMTRHEEYRVRGIALPALAGSEKLADSHLFLPYNTSFQEIYTAISGRSLPASIEHVYLIAWDKWKLWVPEEGIEALDGLSSLYDRVNFPEKGAWWVAYSFLVTFVVSFLLSLVSRLRQPRKLREIMGKHFLRLLAFSVTELAGMLGLAKVVIPLLSWAMSIGGHSLAVLLIAVVSTLVTLLGYLFGGAYPRN